MSIINYDEISYLEIVTFMNVAQTLNMSISAKKLNVSQPAISKRIRQLEENHGLILFTRDKNRLKLTPAGKAFYQELLLSVSHMENAFMKAADVQACAIKTLRIAYDGFFDIPVLYEIISRFTKKYPYTKIDIYNFYEESCRDLFNGKTDIMICPNSFFSSTHEYVKSELISAWNFAILVSKENPLAQRETLEIQDLVGVPLTVAHLEANSPYVLTMKSIFGKYGYSPRIEYLVTRDSLCFEILNRNGVGIASPSFWNRLNERTRSFFEEHIRVYPLKNEFYPVSFVWKGDNTDPNIGRFIEMYQEVCHEGNNQTIIHQAYQ